MDGLYLAELAVAEIGENVNTEIRLDARIAAGADLPRLVRLEPRLGVVGKGDVLRDVHACAELELRL